MEKFLHKYDDFSIHRLILQFPCKIEHRETNHEICQYDHKRNAMDLQSHHHWDIEMDNYRDLLYHEKELYYIKIKEDNLILE